MMSNVSAQEEIAKGTQVYVDSPVKELNRYICNVVKYSRSSKKYTVGIKPIQVLSV